MAFLHGKETKVYIGGNDVSCWFNDASHANTVETGETTVFCNTGDAKTFIAGGNDGTISLSGLFDGATDAIDDQMATIMSAGETHVLYALTGLAATNDAVRFCTGRPTNYSITSPVADVVNISADFQADAGVLLGIGLAPTTATASGNNATAHDNGAATTNGAVYQFNVTANTRNAATTLYVYHSADNSTFAALGAGISVPATQTGSYSLAIASNTTINRYVRFQWVISSGTGSISFVGAFARR